MVIRSYRRVFEVDRRIYRVDRWALPVPGGVPLRAVGYFMGTLLLMWLLNLLVQRTTLGRCMRAVAEDREVAAVMGVNVRQVISLTFLLGSALGGAAGVLVGLYYTQIDFFMGYSAGLKAFTAGTKMSAEATVRPRIELQPPTISTRPDLRRRCPSSPNSGMDRWREYRTSSSREKSEPTQTY